ncbi:hypothetical protein [Nocardia fusca]|uniref:hypothetical protein n=1 Tax=Nocardia fusca TaxID=941183 RepID=UPI0007A765CE|nr:hypothetical protein [Nocardia fusca]
MATTLATHGASVAAVVALWYSGQSLKMSNDQQSTARQTATRGPWFCAGPLRISRSGPALDGVLAFGC